MSKEEEEEEDSTMTQEMASINRPNGSSAQINAHAPVADVPVSNLKDLDLNQGDMITML